jgi:ADP-heptose:LPS heptosyltransferase
LKACPVRRSQWRHTLDQLSNKPKIGIAWHGGGKLTARENRSIPVETFRELAEYGDLINLEYDLQDTKDMQIYTFDFATITSDYDDTAALVVELDYVVTVCTAMVHLCGGLGVPCHVLVPEKPSWRYAYDDMIWYDSVTLHHNKGDWKALIHEVIENAENLHRFRCG